MRFSVVDYPRIFTTAEIMERITYPPGTCWISKFGPTYPIRYDGEIVLCDMLDIISALFLERFVYKSNKKCKTKNCLNPFHYLKV